MMVTESEINQKLDRVATVLIGAVAAVSAALALFGVSSDRVWALLDDDDVAPYILIAAILAVVAVGLALVSYLLPAGRNALEAALLGIGLSAYIAGLVLAMWASASGADSPGRPSVTAVAVEESDGVRLLTFTVRSQSLDPDQMLGVRVTVDGTEVVYESTLRPSPAGVAELVATVPVGSTAVTVEVAAWRLDDFATPDCDRPLVQQRAGCATITP